MPTMFLHVISLIISLSHVASGAIFQSFSDVPKNVKYDFIVAGGGTAGCVIANRLTENSKFNVLVLEAGPSNEGEIALQIPQAPSLTDFADDFLPFYWNFSTTAQSGLNNRTLPYFKGHVLGGSSSINGMVYTRGSADDYNRWAAVTGDEGWSWDRMLPFILGNERFTLPEDIHSINGQFDPAFHNFTGINYVSLPGYPSPLDDALLQTTKDAQSSFNFTLDMNDGSPLGLGWSQSTIGHGERSSSATSYLGPRYIKRKNLHVVLNSRVLRVLPSNSGKIIDLRTMEFVSGSNRIRTINAHKEVILSMGTIGTPYVLLHSGIGDKQELKEVGIKPVLHHPSVGKNLSDQLALPLIWTLNLTVPPLNSTAALDQWLNSRTGPYVAGFTNQIAWGRVANASVFDGMGDPAAGPNSPHYEILPYLTYTANETVLTIVLEAVTPLSRGTITIRSNNSFEDPIIDPALGTTEIDLSIIKEAVSAASKLVSGITLQPQGAFANVTDELSLETYIRNYGYPGFHPVGTAAMSSEKAKYGVVNPDLLLKGAEGLRIVDASVMPFVTCGHTQAPTYAIAERAAEIIKKKWQ